MKSVASVPSTEQSLLLSYIIERFFFIIKKHRERKEKEH